MYASKRDKEDAIIADLKTARQPHEDLWRQIDDHISPGGLRLQLSDKARGTREDGLIINGTADKCFETFSNGMIAYGTNPSEPWLKIEPEDPDLAKYGPVATFCEDVARDQLEIIEDAGVYEDYKAVFANGGKFGNGLLWMEERLDGRVIHTQSMAPGQWWVGKDQYDDPNCFYREMRLTVRQVVEKFGGDPRKPDWEKFSREVKAEWDAGRYGTAVDVGHLVIPNDDYSPKHIDAKNKRFRSCYFEIGKDKGSKDYGKYLRESGYDQFPALFFPWDTLGDDVYGMNSPGMVSLSDVKELQHWALKTAEAVDKIVNPPLMGSATARMLKVGFFPGAITAISDQDMQRGGLKPLHESPGKVIEANDREFRIEDRIKDAWHMKAFRYLDVVDDSKRTATEIAARQQQSMLELVGPMNRINRGILNPSTERIFGYQVAQGRVGPRGIPIPEELNGAKLKIRYISRMAQAMRSVNIAGIDQILQTAIMIAKDGNNPKVWNTINIHELMYARAKATDVPARVMRGADEVMAMEAAQAQAQAQQAQVEQINSLSQTAKNLAQSPTGEKNALTDVAGALAGQAAA
jgi:hypothetical protein